MNIQQRKLSIIEAVVKVQSEELISKFESFLEIENDIANSYPFTKEEMAERLNKSMDDYENGRVTNHKEVIASLKK